MNVTKLIERLRYSRYEHDNGIGDEAADALEAQTREIADLQAGWQRTYDHDVARLQERLAAAERERDEALALLREVQKRMQNLLSRRHGDNVIMNPDEYLRATLSRLHRHAT